MTSGEYLAVIALIDRALTVPASAPNRVGDVSFRADLIRIRAKAAGEMLKSVAREKAGALPLAD